jgi:hypothetical protein
MLKLYRQSLSPLVAAGGGVQPPPPLDLPLPSRPPIKKAGGGGGGGGGGRPPPLDLPSPPPLYLPPPLPSSPPIKKAGGGGGGGGGERPPPDQQIKYLESRGIKVKVKKETVLLPIVYDLVTSFEDKLENIIGTQVPVGKQQKLYKLLAIPVSYDNIEILISVKYILSLTDLIKASKITTLIIEQPLLRSYISTKSISLFIQDTLPEGYRVPNPPFPIPPPPPP